MLKLFILSCVIALAASAPAEQVVAKSLSTSVTEDKGDPLNPNDDKIVKQTSLKETSVKSDGTVATVDKTIANVYNPYAPGFNPYSPFYNPYNLNNPYAYYNIYNPSSPYYNPNPLSPLNPRSPYFNPYTPYNPYAPLNPAYAPRSYYAY